MPRTVKTYKVIVVASRELVYTVEAVSPEEAEVIVEAELQAGQEGELEPIADTLLDTEISECFALAEDDSHFSQLGFDSDATGWKEPLDPFEVELD